MTNGITLQELEENDRNAFILENQYAFKYGACEEFGCRDEHFEEDGEIISRRTIEESIDGGIAYRICREEEKLGGLVLKLDSEKRRGELELLFVTPSEHGRGVGYAAWCEVEKVYPEIDVWETCTPYFEKRNIHFYVNKCGFKIVEFRCEYNRDPHEAEYGDEGCDGDSGEMFRFEKVIR